MEHSPRRCICAENRAGRRRCDGPGPEPGDCHAIGPDADRKSTQLSGKHPLYHEWSILRGGVYVPKIVPADVGVTAQDQNREIVTPSGQTLTLLNPGAVSREVFELLEQQTGVRGHITSLKPFQAANRPDDWERQALEGFEKGRKEVSSVETIQGERYFRMMRPLVTMPACLRCHEEAGRKPGEIRGGISVTVPIRPFVSRGINRWLKVADRKSTRLN